MNPVIIAAGIYLSTRIISFIAGELTEKELKKQKEIEQEIEQIQLRFKENESVNIESETKYKNICSYLKSEAELRQAELMTLRDEIGDTKRRVISALKSKDVIHTPLRRSSLEILLRQLSEAQEKCKSYEQYLKAYCDEVGQLSKGEVVAFSMLLPANYPYIGKVLWIETDQLCENCLKYKISGLFDISIDITDSIFNDFIENSIVPIMITDSHKKKFSASLEKGAFKAYELANTHLGLSATVKEIQKNYVILTYRNQLELFLSKENLIKPDRFPPIRSLLTVYPIKWENNLNYFKYGNGKIGYPVMVSERKEDATSSLSFKCFPICFREEEFTEFINYYNKNNLQEYDEEFLIGPMNSDDYKLCKGSVLKLQFGDIPLFYIKVDEYEDRDDVLRYFFRYNGMCDINEKTFSADDVFVPFEVGFAPYYAGTSIEMIQQYMDIDDINDVSAFIWDVFEEFRIQNQIRKDREGIGYFYKWENITNQLISALEQGDSISVNVKWVDGKHNNIIFADVLNPKQLEDFIQQFARKTDSLLMHKWVPQFFVKDDRDNRYVTTVIDSGKRLRIVGKNVAELFGDTADFVELFASNRPYAEYQQKTALRQLRIGQVVNPSIQAACLNSASIIGSVEKNCVLVPFYNKNLLNNLSQREVVEKAFKEKNIFLIQGPPGTGKTTVIRELIEQVFQRDDNSRILIVSQANVAVDNALSGLINKYESQTVRCGSGNKIGDDFQKLRLQRRCQDYLDELRQRKDDFDEDFFCDWEETIISNEGEDYSPALCELIIRNHRLIGATCVGLAKRKIGLERMEFDLAIIDEAGKALPAEMLIPLIRAKKAIIIGDQKQLPPVINPILYDEERIDLEERAISENDLFCHSFFERLFDNAPDSNKMMLDTQYRMPSVIGTAVSRLFYEGKLKNGPGTEKKEPILFGRNLNFIDFECNKKYCENKNSKQITNFVEAKAVVSLVMSIRKKDCLCKIAVITPYRGQKRLISNTLVTSGIHYQIDNIYVDTVDSFQGSEADVVIFCTTRTVKPTIFFKDAKRINVALSRAKRELIILGKLSYFYRYRRKESCLPELADYIKNNGNVINSIDCKEVQMPVNKMKTTEILLPLVDISIPTLYYTEEHDQKLVKKLIDEFYKHGDFLMPLIVKKTPMGYMLKGNFEQYQAAQEMGIVESLCKIV